VTQSIFKCAKISIVALMLTASVSTLAQAQEVRDVTLAEWTSVNWSDRDFGTLYAGDGWKVHLAQSKNGDAVTNIVTISHGETAPQSFEISIEDFARGMIGLYPFEEDMGNAIYFSTDSGGTHCCTTATIFQMNGGELTAVPLGEFDGGRPEPQDLDNDGLFELVTRDQRFNYAFSSYAESYPPERILRVAFGEVEDVTTDSEFQPRLQQQTLRRLEALAQENGVIPAGLVAGLLATASQAGLYHGVVGYLSREVFEQTGAEYAACYGPDCPADPNYKNLGAALMDRLTTWGYDLKDRRDEKADGILAELAKNTDGFGDNQGGMGSCGIGQTIFSHHEGQYEYQGSDFRCRIANAKMVGSALLTRSICWVENDPIVENAILTKEGDNLSIARWQGNFQDYFTNQNGFVTIQQCKR
jgi:hypothetical protein